MKTSIARNAFVAPSLGLTFGLTLGIALAPLTASAQNPAPVIDLSPENSSAAKPATAANTTVGDRYYQSQMLQNEVRELRGLVEQLNYELQRVKQRQMDDYLDIDRRLSALHSADAPADPSLTVDSQATNTVAAQQLTETATGEMTSASAAVQAGQAAAQPISKPEIQAMEAPVIDSEEIAENYAQASNLLLKQRDFKGAVQAFKQHVINYPNSPYIANAYYWLGEIYLLQGQDELARQAFTRVVEQYSGHSKSLDANFKLGKIYHQLGETERARVLLETAAKGTGGAANKARSYLENNF